MELGLAALANQSRDVVQQSHPAEHGNLGKQMTPTFFVAMIFIVAGVALGQAD